MERIYYRPGGAVGKGAFKGGSKSNKFGSQFSGTLRPASKSLSVWGPLIWFIFILTVAYLSDI